MPVEITIRPGPTSGPSSPAAGRPIADRARFAGGARPVRTCSRRAGCPPRRAPTIRPSARNRAAFTFAFSTSVARIVPLAPSRRRSPRRTSTAAVPSALGTEPRPKLREAGAGREGRERRLRAAGEIEDAHLAGAGVRGRRAPRARARRAPHPRSGSGRRRRATLAGSDSWRPPVPTEGRRERPRTPERRAPSSPSARGQHPSTRSGGALDSSCTSTGRGGSLRRSTSVRPVPPRDSLQRTAHRPSAEKLTSPPAVALGDRPLHATATSTWR